SVMSRYEIGRALKLPFIPGRRNRDAMILSPYDTHIDFVGHSAASNPARRGTFFRPSMRWWRRVERSADAFPYRAKNSRLRALARSGAGRLSGEGGQHQQWDFQSSRRARRWPALRARVLIDRIRREVDCVAGRRRPRRTPVRGAKRHAWQAAAVDR